MPVPTRRRAVIELHQAWDHTCFLAAATAPHECRTERLAREVSGATITPYATTPDWWLLTAGFLVLRFVGFWCTDDLFADGEYGEARQFADAVLAMLDDARINAPLYGAQTADVLAVLDQLRYMLDVLVADARTDVTMVAQPLLAYALLLRDIARDAAPAFRPAGVHALLTGLAIHVFQFTASVFDPDQRPATVRTLRRGIDRSQLSVLYMEWGVTELRDANNPEVAATLLTRAHRIARAAGNATLATYCAGFLSSAQQQFDKLDPDLPAPSEPLVAARS